MKLPDKFKETALQRYQEAKRFHRNWRGGARDDFAFVAGKQWDEADSQKLKDEERPCITFNYSEKMVDAVVGAEVSSRQEITYAPRTVDDSPYAEMETNAAKWVRDEADTEDEESDAFRDALICGVGWTHTRVSYEEDPAGMLQTDRKDPLTMLWDPSSTKPAFKDRRYTFCEAFIDESQARRQWPRETLLGMDDSEKGESGFDHIQTGNRYRPEEGDDESEDIHKDQVLVLHYECVELVPYYRVQTEGGMVDVDVTAFANLRKGFDERGVKYVKMLKREYYNAYFTGEIMLEASLSPTQKGFTYQAITVKRDRNKNTWYGLTRVMKDPQKWANKWLSQILHIINTNAKGGLVVEKDALLDPTKAQEDWSSPDGVVFLKEGGITKFKEKTMSSYPAGLDKLMQFALASLPQVTGINLEALGLAAREQANVLEQSRKQAAFGLLSPVFDALRRYRKLQGRILLDLMNTYISDERMIRIGGAESQQFIPLRKVPDAAKFDIIIDQSPTAPDIKRETWSVLETLIPAAMKAGMPIPPGILKYAPIPTALATEWQQASQQAQGKVSPEQMQKLQDELAKTKEENQKLQTQLKDKSAELQMDFQKMQEEFKMEQQKMISDFQIEMAKLQQKMQLEAALGQQKLQQQDEQHRVDLSLQQDQHEATIAMQRQKLAQQPAKPSKE